MNLTLATRTGYEHHDNSLRCLGNLLAPANPKDKSLVEIKTVLLDHFEPKRNVVAERFRFHKRCQNHGESVAEFVAEVRRLAARCSFGNYLDEALRDRIVCGLNSEAMQKHLLTENDLTLPKTIDIAQSMETAQKDAKALQARPPELTVDRAVDAIKSTTEHSDAPCPRCGKYGHTAIVCNHRSVTCHKCGKKGHLARVCRGGGRRRYSGQTNQVADDKPYCEDVINRVNKLGCPSPSPYRVTLEINGKPLEMEIDTGATVSIISEITKKALFPKAKLNQTSLALHTYSAEPLTVLGQMSVEVKYNHYVGTHNLTVVKGKGSSLLGRDWLKMIHIDWASIKAVEPTGTVPYALKEKIGKELDRLEDAGVLKKVIYSDWAAPIVPVVKKDGSIRICGDYKVTINPLPKPTDLMSCLTGGQRFSKLDLSSAYQQIVLDEASSKMVVINTHQGLYQYTRLPFGVASALAIFQKATDSMLQGIPYCICYLDDILVSGRSDEEHMRNLKTVLERLQEHGVRLR